MPRRQRNNRKTYKGICAERLAFSDQTLNKSIVNLFVIRERQSAATRTIQSAANGNNAKIIGNLSALNRICVSNDQGYPRQRRERLLALQERALPTSALHSGQDRGAKWLPVVLSVGPDLSQGVSPLL